jgi:predicted dienelactone hydrolase
VAWQYEASAGHDDLVSGRSGRGGEAAAARTPDNPLFDGGRAAVDAALAPTPAEFPLIVLSHGTGGVAGNLAWLGTALARAGYVAAAVNHPGNNWIDGYTVAGFTLWWERARDLSAVIDGMLADPTFMTRIDAARIGAAGFSLGGYTMIAIAGGITSLAHFREFCASPDVENASQASPEFPDLRAKAKALADSDEAFRAALANDSRSYRDKRVRAVLAMAPGRGPASAFLPESLEEIDIPVAIVAGAANASGARFYAARIPHAELTIFPGDVGHYVFMPVVPPKAALPFRRCASTLPVSTATPSTYRRRNSRKRSLRAIWRGDPPCTAVQRRR